VTSHLFVRVTAVRPHHITLKAYQVALFVIHQLVRLKNVVFRILNAVHSYVSRAIIQSLINHSSFALHLFVYLSIAALSTLHVKHMLEYVVRF
jgi:hypothetical protein